MILNIEYEFLDHPYSDEPSSKGEQWSKIRLEVLNDKGQLIKTALDWQWDIIVFLDWVIENEFALQHENIPEGIKNRSIARGMFDFYKHLDPNTEDLTFYDKVYNYRTKHDLSFALRGADINDVYIGLNDGQTTISLYSKKGRWNYIVDLDGFFKKIHSIYREIYPKKN